jgi:hypothetical protein
MVYKPCDRRTIAWVATPPGGSVRKRYEVIARIVE